MTEQAKHTPGPWQAEDGLDEPTVESEDFVVASCHQARAMDDGESVANARLIAAAPEMAGLLEECEIALETLLEDFLDELEDEDTPLKEIEANQHLVREEYRELFEKITQVSRKAGVLDDTNGEDTE